jgi:hypothetical protein
MIDLKQLRKDLQYILDTKFDDVYPTHYRRICNGDLVPIEQVVALLGETLCVNY